MGEISGNSELDPHSHPRIPHYNVGDDECSSPNVVMGERGCGAKKYKLFSCLVWQFASYLPSPSMKECDRVRIGQSSAKFVFTEDATFSTFAFPDYFSHLWY